jgi:hypothetical protein
MQLGCGSGSQTLDRCTAYGNGVAPAINTFSPSKQYLLCWRSWSHITIKLRLDQNWFIVAAAPQQWFYVHAKPWGGGGNNDFYGHVSKPEPQWAASLDLEPYLDWGLRILVGSGVLCLGGCGDLTWDGFSNGSDVQHGKLEPGSRSRISGAVIKSVALAMCQILRHSQVWSTPAYFTAQQHYLSFSYKQCCGPGSRPELKIRCLSKFFYISFF